MIVFINGLMGTGKSTVAKAIAEKLHWTFLEADTFLTKEQKEKISRGVLLTQAELDEWIYEKVIPAVLKLEKVNPVVISGIFSKQNAEKLKAECQTVLFINLVAPFAVLEERVKGRVHFAGVEHLKIGWKFKDHLKLPGPEVDASRPVLKVIEECLNLIEKAYSVN